MRVHEVAQLLGVSADWLRRLERQGRVPTATRDLNGCRRYTALDVERLRAVLFKARSSARHEPSPGA